MTLGLVDSNAAAMVIEAQIEKAEEKVSRLEEKLESAIKNLEKSDSLTGFGFKKSGSPLEGLEILSAELNDGKLLVKFSDEIAFQEHSKKRFKSFFGHKKLNTKMAEILGGNLLASMCLLSDSHSMTLSSKCSLPGKSKEILIV